jgi:hypothetical protein
LGINFSCAVTQSGSSAEQQVMWILPVRAIMRNAVILCICVCNIFSEYMLHTHMSEAEAWDERYHNITGSLV